MSSDEDQQEEAVRRRPTGPVYSSVAFAECEDALDKLRILNYESDFCSAQSRQPLHRAFFALPSHNPAEQFSTFLDLAAWLAELISGNAEFLQFEKYDDPNTSVNKLMMSLKQLGFDLDFPAAKLKSGWGDRTVHVLLWLCDKALEARGFQWQAPAYNESEDMEEAEADDDADVDNIADEAEEAVEEEAMFSEVVRGPQRDEESVAMQEMLAATVDPLEWQTELERVGPRLKVRPTAASKEWREHIELTRQHEATITKMLPNTQSALQQISGQIGEALERVRSRERHLNSQYEALRVEYQQVSEQLKAVQQRMEGTSNNVSDLTGQLSEIAERLSEVKSTTDNRSNSMTDSSPLVQIKHALVQIKDEIKTFELRIGVVSHTLLQAQLRSKTAADAATTATRTPIDEPDFEMSDDDFS